MFNFYATGINKKPISENSEDLIGYSNNFFWLLDGATPPFNSQNTKLTQDYIKNLNLAFTKYSLECTDTNELLYKGIQYVKKFFEEKYDINNMQYLPYSTVVIIKIEKDKLKYTVLSDSYLVFYSEKYQEVITDDRLKKIAIKERKIVQNLKRTGIDEKSKEYISARKSLINVERLYQNKKGGYFVSCLDENVVNETINGEINLNLNNNWTIFVLSDGLARLVTNFCIYENFISLSEDIIKNGSMYIFNKLRKLEEDDCNCVNPVSSKNDDASYFIIKE